MLEFECPKCKKTYRVGNFAAGKSARCSTCGGRLIPAIESDEPSGAAPKARAAATAFRPLTGVLIGVAAILVLALAWYGWRSYERFERNKRAIELYNEAQDAITAKQYGEALDALTHCLQIKPRWQAAAFQAAILSLRLKKDDAPARFKGFLALQPEKKYRAIAYANLAYFVLSETKPDRKAAKTLLQHAHTHDPRLPAANLMLAGLALDAGATDAAATYLDKVAKNGLPDEAEALRLRLQMRLDHARGDAAAFARSSLLVQGRAQPETVRKEATVMALDFLARDQDGGETGRKQMLRLATAAPAVLTSDDTKRKARQTLAKQYYDQGAYAKAAAILEQVVGTPPKPSVWTHLLADCYARQLQDEQATPADEESRNDTPKPSTQTPEAMAARAVELYNLLLADAVYAKQGGKPLLLQAIAVCDRAGQTEPATAFVRLGRERYPGDASFHRRLGMLALRNADYREGLAHLRKSLELDPAQPTLASELARYEHPPHFDGFRPAKPGEFTTRPLIHVAIHSGTPLPVNMDKTTMTLDGQTVEFVAGGNELFFVPAKELAGGRHAVVVTAEDALGNRASATFRFGLDLNPPAVHLVAPPDGQTDDPKAVIELRIADELGTVDPQSITVMLRSAPGSEVPRSFSIVRAGQYRITDEKLGIQRGDTITRPEALRFRIDSGLAPGVYDIEVRAADTAGHEGESKVRLQVRPPAE